jgi:hypothetical protein
VRVEKLAIVRKAIADRRPIEEILKLLEQEPSPHQRKRSQNFTPKNQNPDSRTALSEFF